MLLIKSCRVTLIFLFNVYPTFKGILSEHGTSGDIIVVNYGVENQKRCDFGEK